MAATIDTHGRRGCVLSDATAASSRLFLDVVLKPILKVPWPAEESDLRHIADISPLVVVQELTNIMLGSQPQSDAGASFCDWTAFEVK